MSPVAENYFGISGYAIFWILFVVAIVLFLQRAYLLVRFLKLGQPENRFDHLGYRITNMLIVTISQWCNLRTVKKNDLAGIGHSFMFWGFCLFLLSYFIFIGFGGGLGFDRLITNTTFEKVYSSILDIAALLILISLLWAAIRRYILKSPRLRGHTGAEAGIILSLVGSLMLLHILIEGFYLAGTDSASVWPPVGAALAKTLNGIPQNTALTVYKGLWWVHYLVILGFLVFIPRSKHLHILASSINVGLKSLTPKGVLTAIDINNKDNLGISKIQDFSWKDLLDGYACTVCGRCNVTCPAQLSGKPLSPRDLILNLKGYLFEIGPSLIKNNATALLSETATASANHGKTLIGNVVSEEAIWACTTCRACQEVCPSSNEQMNKIIGMRRHLQMVAMTETAEDPLKNLWTRGNPWRGTLYSRTDWAEGLDIKIVGEDSNIDTLFWVGCTGALEDRSLKVVQALAKLMKQAGMNFGILGEEETCCGDPSRRLGAEHQFQMLAGNNIQILQSYNIKKIVTACPHCFNTLKNEYPQLGGHFEVIHHSQLLAELFKDHKLNIPQRRDCKVTYHESCYLGRYNNIFDPPRQVLSSIPGLNLVEMEKNRKDGFCCGGGGGRILLEEKIGQRISEMRLGQALETKAEIVATACPFCLQMFEDAAKAKEVEESLKIKDIAELIAEATDVSGDPKC